MSSNTLLGSSPIRSIQRGTVSGDQDDINNVTISSVNTEKSFVSISSANGVAGQTGEVNALVFNGRLTSSTNLRVTCGTSAHTADNIAGTAAWEVIEYV